MRQNKKGQSVIFVFLLLIGVFFTAILLLIGGLVFIKINAALDQDIDIGQVNLADINDDTFGIATSTYLNNADWWGLSVIFGMIMGLFLSSYILRNRYPKWGMILDMLIIVTSYIIALYISSSYQTLLEALAGAGENFLEQYTPKTSMFIVNLHIFVTIVGSIMMFLFHSSIPKKSEENIQQGGFLQGV